MPSELACAGRRILARQHSLEAVQFLQGDATGRHMASVR